MKHEPGSKERGQTTAEYVAITSVAVVITITVVWLTFWNSINTALGELDTKIADFITGAFP